jgi:hypothetical protein
MKKNINPRIDIIVHAAAYGIIAALAIIMHNLFIYIYQNHLPL